MFAGEPRSCATPAPFLRCSFRLSRCDSFDDGAQLLSADYRIECSSERYRHMLGIAIFMFVLFPIGIPAVLGLTLWRKRHTLYARNTGAVIAVSFGPGDVIAAPVPLQPLGEGSREEEPVQEPGANVGAGAGAGARARAEVDASGSDPSGSDPWASSRAPGGPPPAPMSPVYEVRGAGLGADAVEARTIVAVRGGDLTPNQRIVLHARVRHRATSR
jgi:hypothetical protein